MTNYKIPSPLAGLELEPLELPTLSASTRSSILRFLLRWDAYQETLDYLDVLDMDHRVSIQDWRAEALEGLGRPAEALVIRKKRWEQKESRPARLALGRCYLLNGDPTAAIDLARQSVDEGYAPAWSLIGDIHLQQGDLNAAEAAYLQHLQASPGSRPPLFGLAQIHQGRGDAVTAAAYAIRALTVEEGQFDVPVPLLRQLRDFFRQTGDENHLLETAARLDERYQQELAGLQEKLGAAPQRRPQQAAAPDAAPAERVAAPLPDLSEIPVSDEERTELETAVRTHFGFPGLLNAQAEIMACARRGEDVLAILPTGGGKSLCYQLPALMDGGLTLVISPLIALMKDQIDGLPQEARRRALAINSSLDGDALNRAVAAMAAGNYNIIYSAPERLRQPPFLDAIRRAGLTRLVIDEAHCISAWGHDFRPDYLSIASVHQALGAPPVLAVTATAPPRVRQDIERRLFGERNSRRATDGRFRLIAADTYRPNLGLHVIAASDKDEKLRRLPELCRQLDGSGIIYARTRKQCEQIAALLRGQGHSAEHYHAGIVDRSVVQDRFMSGRTRIIVATIAFGMGVDKPDIRFIIHFGLPNSVESYYQEAGRAGRDGRPAHCILLFSNSDKATLTRHANAAVIPVEFLREAYGAVRQRLNGRGTAAVPLDDLVRDLRGDDVTVRVALSLLEQAGLLQRHHDAPRTVSLHRLSQGDNADFDRFADAARLRPGQTVTRAFQSLVRAGEWAAEALEEQLLAWETAGHLRYGANGRDCLLTLPPAPTDAATRIDSLLSQYAVIQQQRVAEIVAYAHNRRCRQAYLSNYLGGQPRTTCDACDNCRDDLLQLDGQSHLPDDAEQLRLVLAALAEQSWGWRNLAGVLRGEPDLQSRAGGMAAFGGLAFRSKTAVRKLVERLVAAELVQEVHLSHGGVALELTGGGRAALAGERPLPEPPRPRKRRPRSRETAVANGSPEIEGGPLYEALVAWRTRRAQADDVPAYVVAHNAVLQTIANERPSTLAALEAIKGMGPAKVEKYGREMLAVVAGEQSELEPETKRAT